MQPAERPTADARRNRRQARGWLFGLPLFPLLLAGACWLSAEQSPEHRDALRLAAGLFAATVLPTFVFAYASNARALCGRCGKPIHASVLRGERMRLSRSCEHCGLPRGG